jgi:histidyl-tRNA synthetase
MKNDVPQVLKGFRDYLPGEQIARRKIMAKISEVYERFGFAPIETPTVEYYDLLGGKYGEEGERLMYKFEDRGGRAVALRYDLTVPLARVMANYPDLPKPFKRYQMGSSFRAENPQKGRYREFTQCDVDIIGSSSLVADAEVIAAMNSAYGALEVGQVIVKFNDRKLIDAALSELGLDQSKVVPFMRILDKLDKIGEDKVLEELEKIGFQGKEFKGYKDIMATISKPFVAEMKNLLSGLGVANMEFDPFLARGLDYYTGTIFEFVLKDKPEFGSIGGGGRYDNLIGKVSGTDMPAVGGSIGLDRMFAALQDAGLVAPQTAAEVLVLNLDNKLVAEYLNMVTNLRGAGIDAEFYYDAVKLDKQFRYAEAKNMKLAVILGEEELKDRKVNIKDLEAKKQVTVDLDELITEVKSMLW